METNKKKSPYALACERHDREVMERYLKQYHAGDINDYDFFKLCQLARGFGIRLEGMR